MDVIKGTLNNHGKRLRHLEGLEVTVADVSGMPLATAQNQMLIASATPAWILLAAPTAEGQALITGADPYTPVWDTTFPTVIQFDAGLTFGGATGVNIVTVPDNLAQAMHIVDADGIEYLRIVSTDAQPVVVFNEDGADVDHRWEASGEANALFIRGSDGWVALGHDVPERMFHIKSDTVNTANVMLEEYSNTANAPDIFQRKGRGTIAAPLDVAVDDGLGACYFVGYRDGAWRIAASLGSRVAALGATVVRGQLNFSTANAAGVLIRHLTIDEDGNSIFATNGGMVGVGDAAAATTDRWIDIDGTVAAAATNYGLVCTPSLGADQIFHAIVARADVDATYTAAITTALYAANPILGGGAATTLNYGLFIEAQTSGATNYGVYQAGAADNYFGGSVGIGIVPSYKLDTMVTGAALVANFFNDGDDSARYGISIQCGDDDASTAGAAYSVMVYDGDRTHCGGLRIVAGVVAVYSVSDIARKTDIRSTGRGGLDEILALPVMDYRRIDDKGVAGPIQTGFVAQDVQKVMPEAVCKVGDITGVSQGMFVPMMVKAIQELDARLGKLELSS